MNNCHVWSSYRHADMNVAVVLNGLVGGMMLHVKTLWWWMKQAARSCYSCDSQNTRVWVPCSLNVSTTAIICLHYVGIKEFAH